MRAVLYATLATVAFFMLVPSPAQSKNCPANANKASMALWSVGSIPNGASRSGTHPCGRKIACTGGSGGGAPGTRKCRWT